MNQLKNKISKATIIMALVALMATLIIPETALARSPNLFDLPRYSSGEKVKNVIVMISDGCGYEHITATDYYQYGATDRQVYEKFSVKVGMSTYEYEGTAPNYKLFGYDPHLAWVNFNYTKDAGLTTDSASAATAMSNGTKTYNGAIGVDILGAPLQHALQLC